MSIKDIKIKEIYFSSDLHQALAAWRSQTTLLQAPSGLALPGRYPRSGAKGTSNELKYSK